MNTTRKLMLVSASTALSFLLIMGLNTAFSANPTANPPETGLTPTFSGLTVDGVSNLGTTNIGAGSFPPTQTLRAFGIAVFDEISSIKTTTNTLEVTKPSTLLAPITIGTDTNNKNFTVFGNIDNNTGSTTTRTLTVKSETVLEGPLDVTGKTTLAGDLSIGTSTNIKNLTVSGNTTITGTLKAASLGLINRRASSQGFVVAGKSTEQTDTCLKGETMIACSAHGALANRYSFVVNGTNIFDNTCYVWTTNTGVTSAELFISTTCLDTDG